MSPSPLRPVPIQELRALPEGKHWQVDQPIADFSTLTPVRGELRIVHHGTAIEVSATVDTIVTLPCARCLQDYNAAIQADLRELLQFNDNPSRHPEGSAERLRDDLEEHIDPRGSFDPERWLFEHLSLRLPLVNRCGDDCPGPPRWSSAPTPADPRWAALRRLSPRSSPPSPS
ncbi:MAG: YceD family protein [Cyanobacteriota bacterium]|nr:YceD family protein [Cyanobacteriota bacterium]